MDGEYHLIGPAMDGEYHLIRLRRVIQRLILIPQPEKFLLPIPFADVRTQFHEGIVNSSGHCVGMIQIAGALDGDSPLVVGAAGRTPGAVLLLHAKSDLSILSDGNLIALADFYGVSVDYLLCRTENREQINTPLTELHLNDEMVALLKSGRINNRLLCELATHKDFIKFLCELATHKDFIKFLADIEIYVDGIATMQIQNLNALVDTVRHEIIERYRPGEDDPHLKVLQAAHISDDEYFSHMVLDDLNLIIRDIREAHKKDSESAPKTTVADELKENLEAVENFKGSRDEKLVILYCKQLGINYKNLSDEELHSAEPSGLRCVSERTLCRA